MFKHITNIEERNKAFDALSDEDKRREIALDCLELTLEGKVQGSYRKYWSDEIGCLKARSAKAFQEKLVNNLPECQVCARGGMMLSQIRLGNSISPRNSCRCSGAEENILKGFSFNSFKMMEKEYEFNEYDHPYYNNTTEKLQNICLNVIYNGDFDINDKTDYLSQFQDENKAII